MSEGIAKGFGPLPPLPEDAYAPNAEPLAPLVRYVRPEHEGPPDHYETSGEKRLRSERNVRARKWWDAVTSDRCSECGQTRFNVVHEMDPANSFEGPEYHADFEHHAFLGTVRLATPVSDDTEGAG